MRTFLITGASTGIGAATPLGHSLNEVADNILAGRSATRRVFDRQGDELVPFVGAEIDRVPAPTAIDSAAFADLSKLHQLALWSAASALDDAGHRIVGKNGDPGRGCSAQSRTGEFRSSAARKAVATGHVGASG